MPVSVEEEACACHMLMCHVHDASHWKSPQQHARFGSKDARNSDKAVMPAASDMYTSEADLQLIKEAVKRP